MAGSNSKKRWTDAEFLRQIAPVLSAVFIGKLTSAAVDLRGVIVGLDGALPQLLQADFQDFRGTEIDLSECKTSCAFSRAQVTKSKFIGSLFDTCRFKDAEFELCSFDKARFESPSFDDTKFRQCSFVGARVAGRRMQEYGGRRAIFERCDFRQTVFRNLQLRACVFRDCRFDGAFFTKCLMVGLKFEGERPSDQSLTDCRL